MDNCSQQLEKGHQWANKHMSRNTWFRSALTHLAVSLAGCGRETINVPDTTPPYVLSTVPALGAAGVAVGAPISATFSKPVNCSTLTTTTFTVAAAGTGGAAVGGAVTCSGSTATFTPTTALVLQDALYGRDYDWGHRPGRQCHGQPLCLEL